MSEKIRILLESLTLEEIEELKNLASKKEKNLKPSYGFSSVNFDVLDNFFDVQQNRDISQIFNNWLLDSEKIELKTEVILFLENLLKKEASYLKDYSEEDLKISFIAPILKQVDFRFEDRKIRDFFEQKLTYSNSKVTLNGTVDFVVAKEHRQTAKTPYFFINEFKKGKDFSDPEPQLLAELISAVELNNWQKIKGAYIIGAIWYFVILEKLDTDKYQYFVSRPYNSVVISDLELIFKTLLFVKQEIINLEESN